MSSGSKKNLFLYLFLFSGYSVQGLEKAPTWHSKSSIQGIILHRELLPELRGGYLYFRRNQPIELNPDYKYYTAPLSGGALDEHEEWLRKQKELQTPTMTTGFQSFQPQQKRRDSMLDGLKQYVMTIHGTSPCVAWTAFSCIVMFVLWQIPSMKRSLIRNCICSRSSIKRTAGLSLILSAVSHASFYHILGNLITLLSFAPSVARNVTKPLWPLFLGSALCSNALFVGLRMYGSTIGLSGITMSILAVQARAAPTKVYTFILAGILPITLSAKNMLDALLGVSLLGSFVPDSKISHLTHLGGLIFGILYYELHVKGPKVPVQYFENIVAIAKKRYLLLAQHVHRGGDLPPLQ